MGQRGRQKLLRTLEAVAREELVLLGDAVVYFDVELIVLPLESRIVKKVADDLTSRRGLPRHIRRRVELFDDVPADHIVTGGRNPVAGKRLLRERIVDDAGQLR